MSFDSNIYEIINIVDDILGKPRRDASVEGWTEYNCPCCAEENGGLVDNKYNFCINYSKGVCHCWKCNTSGRLSKYIKQYGGINKLREYKEIVRDIRKCQQYTLENNFISNDIDILKNENTISLPDDYISLIGNDTPYAKEALEYLYRRGIDENMIKRFNIGYTNRWTKDYNMKNRIIIPSYDEFGELNYYVARDYTGKNKKRKYNNPNIPKTTYIFNEGMINWYEDITIVEGVFDHMVVPNSVALLGKTLDKEDALYNALLNRSMANINILLDDDAINDAKKLYFKLEESPLSGKIRLIECPKGYDASLLYQQYGVRGIRELMKTRKKLNIFEKVFKI